MSIYTIFASNPAKTYWSTDPSQSEADILKNNPAIAALDPETRATVLGTLKGDDVLITPKLDTVDAMTKAMKDWSNRLNKTRDARKQALVGLLAGAQSEEYIETVRKKAELAPAKLMEILEEGGQAAPTTIAFLKAQYEHNAAVAAERLKTGEKNAA